MWNHLCEPRSIFVFHARTNRSPVIAADRCSACRITGHRGLAMHAPCCIAESMVFPASCFCNANRHESPFLGSFPPVLALPFPSLHWNLPPTPPFPFPREKILPALRLTLELTQRFEFGGKLVRVSKAHPPTSTFRGAFWSAFEGIRIGSWILHAHHDVLGRSQFDRWRWKRPEWTAWRC